MLFLSRRKKGENLKGMIVHGIIYGPHFSAWRNELVCPRCCGATGYFCWFRGSRHRNFWTNLCFSSSSAYFGKWIGEGGGYEYQYEGRASGQLTQQESLGLRTCNSLASLRAAAWAQMTQNILTRTDRHVFLKSLLEVEIFH